MVVYVEPITWQSKVRYAIYEDDNYSPGNVLIETEGWSQIQEYPNYWEGWKEIFFPTDLTVVKDTYYWLAILTKNSVRFFYEYPGATNQSCNKIEVTAFPDPFPEPTGWKDRKYSFYARIRPEIGDFVCSENTLYSWEWFDVGCKIADPEESAGGLINCTLTLDPGPVVLRWDYDTVFSIYYDPNGYAEINTSACVEDGIEWNGNGGYNLTWRIRLKQTYPHDSSVDVVDTGPYPTLVWNDNDENGTGTYERFFLFEPEEKHENQGGGLSRPKTPLERMGIPTPLPYEVAPPEAQYGTIGLVVIMVGAVIYYIRRPKTTQQLFKEATASRVSYGPRKARKRKIQQKKQPKRRIHKKK